MILFLQISIIMQPCTNSISLPSFALHVCRCDLALLFLEIERVLRPGGWLLVREHQRFEPLLWSLAESFHWELKYSETQTDEILKVYEKGFWRPDA